MAIDRRALLAGGCLFLATACARAAEPRKQRSEARRPKPLSPAIRQHWQDYKSAFLDPSGRIVDNGNGGISHSEGQGYGLAFALWTNDKPAFDSILNWTEKTLARSDASLFAWRYDPREANPVADRNNATDADIFIAWALAGAARQWQDESYAALSGAIRKSIQARLVVELYGRKMLLPGLEGFVSPQAVTLNPSYYVWPALDAFRELDGRGAWGQVIADGEALLGAARFGPLGLPTDWIDVTARDVVVPAAGRPPRFGFDAVRTPLYALAGRRKTLAEPARKFWTNYSRDQGPIPAWIDVVSGVAAPYPLSSGGQAVASRLGGTPPPTTLSKDYYAASLQMLCGLLF
jgi:endoglucanase